MLKMKCYSSTDNHYTQCPVVRGDIPDKYTAILCLIFIYFMYPDKHHVCIIDSRIGISNSKKI